ELLSLRRPSGRTTALALLAGVPSVLVVAWHGVHSGFERLLSRDAGWLVLRIVLNQALLEEVLARGLLLGLLLRAGVGRRRTVWVSSASFALMHMEQFLLPPVRMEGIVNGLVLLVITLPVGIALAQLTLASRSLAPAIILHLLMDLTILPQKLY